MNIKPSTALRNGYTQISELAKESGEPIVITNKGEADLIILSVEAFEEREKMFRHRDKVYEAEIARLNDMATYTPERIHAELERRYAKGGIVCQRICHNEEEPGVLMSRLTGNTMTTPPIAGPAELPINRKPSLFR